MKNLSEKHKEISIFFDLLDFIIPELNVRKSKHETNRIKKDNNIYFTDIDGLRYFQYNQVTNELGFYYKIHEDFSKYLPNELLLFFECIKKWFNTKFSLTVNGMPFKITKCFIG